MTGALVLTDPWWDLRGGGRIEDDQRLILHEELLRETGAGHPLAGQVVIVIGRSAARDDILVTLERGGWAIVHLTWKRSREDPPWPVTVFYHDIAALEEALDMTAD